MIQMSESVRKCPENVQKEPRKYRISKKVYESALKCTEDTEAIGSDRKRKKMGGMLFRFFTP